MKALIKPTLVMSFILMLTGLVPEIDVVMPILGFLSMVVWGLVGVFVLGAQDRDYDSQLELIRIEHLKASEVANVAIKLISDHHKKYEELESRVSKAISENRELAGRLR